LAWPGSQWLWLPESSGQSIEVGFGLAWQCDKSYALQGDKPGALIKYWECIAVVKATAETVAMVDTVVACVYVTILGKIDNNVDAPTT
jgi:hypothetical protein